jgi:hypothetical protein
MHRAASQQEEAAAALAAQVTNLSRSIVCVNPILHHIEVAAYSAMVVGAHLNM